MLSAKEAASFYANQYTYYTRSWYWLTIEFVVPIVVIKYTYPVYTISNRKLLTLLLGNVIFYQILFLDR